MGNRTKIMGILNATDDSLYGGNLHMSHGELGGHVWTLIEQGASYIDIGAESTGPGSKDVTAEEEWQRLEPFLRFVAEAKKEEPTFEISIDTYKTEVLRNALKYEIDMLNDITALRGDEGLAELVAESGIKVCLMYNAHNLKADGNDMRVNNTMFLQYDDLIQSIGDFLQERIDYALSKGIKKSQIILDPGMGAFLGADPKYSFELISRLNELKERFPQYPLLIGVSRKGFTGMQYGTDLVLPPSERLLPSLLAMAIAVDRGADIVRVHDMEETVKALNFLDNF